MELTTENVPAELAKRLYLTVEKNETFNPIRVEYEIWFGTDNHTFVIGKENYKNSKMMATFRKQIDAEVYMVNFLKVLIYSGIDIRVSRVGHDNKY